MPRGRLNEEPKLGTVFRALAVPRLLKSAGGRGTDRENVGLSLDPNRPEFSEGDLTPLCDGRGTG